MLKSDVFYGNSLIPVVLVAAILTGALWRSSPSSEPPRADEPAAHAEAADAASAPTAWVSDVRPALETIAAAMGVGPQDLQPNLRHAAEMTAARPRNPRREDPDLHALAELQTGMRFTPDGSDTCPANAPAVQTAAGDIGAWLLSEDSGSAARKALAAALLEQYRDWRTLATLTAKAAGHYQVQFLVATVPDYVDSNSDWLADQSLAAIQSGMTSRDFLFDRITLIDWSRDGGGGTRVQTGRRHERQPGVIVFRRVEADHVRLQIVLLVLETPTGGIHQQALRNSLSLARAWQACSGGGTSTLRVLGPTFSGSVISLATVLAEFRDAFTHRLVISGSANADENDARMTAFSGGASYRSLVQPSAVLTSVMASVLGSMRPEWKDGRRVALLTESNTAYGHRDSTVAGPPGAFAPDEFHFPLHVAQLRSDAPAESSPGAALMPTTIVPLNLRESAPPSDLIPALRPHLTSPVVEATVAEILDAIRHEKYTAVGILATDNRDVLFLAREVKRAAPDVQLFLFGTHAIYLHPDYVPYLRGALVASSYSLSLTDQPEIGDGLTRRSREPFQSMAAAGLFYATRALLRDDYPDVAPAADPRAYAPYCAPNSAAESPAREPSPPCVPVAPASVSVIGDDGYWMLPSAPIVAPSAVTVAQPNVPPLPPVPDRVMFVAALIALVVLAHPVTLYLIRRARRSETARSRFLGRPFVRVLAPLDPGAAGADYHRITVGLCMVLLALVAAWLAAVLVPSAARVVIALFTPMALAAVLATADVARHAPAAPAALDRAPRPQRRAVNDAERLGRVLFLGMLATFALFAAVTIALIPGVRSEPARTLVLARIIGGGIVSPAALILTLSAAIYTVLFTSMRRLSLVGYGYERLRTGSPAFAFLTGGNGRLASILDMPAQNLPSTYPRAVALVVLGAMPAAWTISTFEGRLFSWFVFFGSLTTLGLALLLVAQALATWNAATPVLDRLVRSRLEPRFKDIAAHVTWNISLAPPRLAELLPMAQLADGVIREFRTNTLSALHPLDARRSRRDPHDFWRFREDAEAQLHVRDEDLVDLEPLLADPRHVANLEAEARVRDHAALIQSRTFRDCWRLADTLVELLRKSSWQRTHAEDAAWLARCEQLVALQVSFVLRDVAARTVTCLFSALLCLTFLTASHLLYAFNGRTAMLTVDLLAVAAAAVSAVWILTDMERDHILSLLRSTTPGRVDINWDFIKRIAVYGVLPLLAVIAALFPEVGGTLFAWLEPLRRLSNF